MAAHLHWRLQFTEGNSTLLIDIGEVEMRATAGGADQCSGGTSSASSNSASASAAFDNSLSTSWSTASSPTFPVWLRYSFAAAVEVTQVVITAYSTGSGWQYSPKSVNVQWSDDGTTWTTEFSASGLTVWSGGSSYTITQGATGGPVRITAQSLEVLNVSAASVRVTGQVIEAFVPTYEMRIAKATGYAVLGIGPGINVSKAAAYAVLHDTSIGAVPDVPVTRRRPVLAFVG